MELNSCNEAVANELIAEIEAEENILELESYMAKVFQEYGWNMSFTLNMPKYLRPTDHMKTSHFPGLAEDGTTITYSRIKALIREDIQFLSWEHPMVNEAMEMVLDSELGNATVVTISIKSLPVGTVFLGNFFIRLIAQPLNTYN